jgi:uncharacterized protein (TIGR04255 family)
VVDRYEDPPIEEVVCEIHFVQNDSWEPTHTGLIYSELEEDFPERDQSKAYGISHRNQEGEPSVPEIKTQERAQFKSEDGNSLIQVSPHFLSANRLRPYESWAEFLPIVESGLGAYESQVSPEGIERVSLRYINRIELDEDEIDLKEYFNFGIRIGEGVPEDFFSFVAGMVTPFEEGRDALKIQMKESRSGDPDTNAVLLELDYSLVESKDVETEDVLEWLETAHEHVVDCFESVITDRVRDTFTPRHDGSKA